MRSAAELAVRLRSRGLKVTPQRECIFEVLHADARHPTAEAVYAVARRRMPTMSLKTVYQTLNDLAQMGEIRLLDVGTGATRFDLNVGRHHHLVCRRCGEVRDLDVAVAAEVPAGAWPGFEADAAELVVRGTCPSCAT